MRRLHAILLLGATAAMGGGCANEPLDISLIVAGETRSLDYHLEPSGLLTVVSGGGLTKDAPDKRLFSQQLDPAQLRSLRQVVSRSGFFLEDPPMGEAFSEGPAMRIAISLGLWENTLNVAGQSVPSVGKIVTELNKYLPTQYQVPCNTAPEGRKESAFDWQ